MSEENKTVSIGWSAIWLFVIMINSCSIDNSLDNIENHMIKKIPNNYNSDVKKKLDDLEEKFSIIKDKGK